jgi:hypothetical protein
MIKNLVFSVVVLMLFGCAAMNKPSPEQITNADYGGYPADYQQVIQDRLSKTMYDPYSAVFTNWRGPSKGYIYDITGVYYGYRVCVDVNGKNRLGGYVGSRPFLFIIKNNEIIKAEEGSEPDVFNVRGVCNSL